MNYSPLRYPGGKSKISSFVNSCINRVNQQNVVYVEPFAGGAGVALTLLLEERVSEIVINDYDKAIYSFWRTLVNHPQDLIDFIETVPLTIEEWKHQKRILLEKNKKFSIELGCAAFYLNRTNRSGILQAGPIGGYNQTGNYKLDARFNRSVLVQRVRAIVNKRKHIHVYNKEIRSFIQQIIPLYQDRAFVYFDPPYFNNGQRLYNNFFSPKDHRIIAQYIIDHVSCPWIMTYDDVEEVRKIYSDFPQQTYTLNYSAANKGKGAEIIIYKEPTLIPNSFSILELRRDHRVSED